MYFVEPNRLWLLLTLTLIFSLMAWSCFVFNKFFQSLQFNNFCFGSNLPTTWMRLANGFLFLLSLAAIIIGLAQPYYLVSVYEKTYHNVRLIFLLDVSLSMITAEDVKPNRLLVAKEEIKNFYLSLGGTYEIALIPFAGDPNIFYCPLSYSRSAFLTMLAEVSDESVLSQGTDLANAFFGLNFLVNKSDWWKKGKNLVILLSDGGKEDGFLVDWAKLQKEVTALAEKGFELYTLGIGEQVLTPLIKRDYSDNFVGFITDNNKQILHSQLDEDILKSIAVWGKGDYRNLKDKAELEKKLSKIVMENRIIDKERVTYKNESLRHWFFALGAVLIWLNSFLNMKLRR